MTRIECREMVQFKYATVGSITLQNAQYFFDGSVNGLVGNLIPIQIGLG
jgi:hypothetical protein